MNIFSLIYLESILAGLLLGYLYGMFFLKRLKNIFLMQDIQGKLKKGPVFKFSFFYILTFILLSSVFVLFVFKFKLNLLLLSFSFLLFFWIIILKGLNKSG